MDRTRAYTGTATATGAVPMRFYGLPSHLQDDEYNPTVNHVFADDMDQISLHVKIPGAATVELQGCDRNPSVAADWFTLESAVTATGLITSTTQVRFARANVTAYTSGTVTCTLSMSD